MTTSIETTAVASDQVSAASALLAILTAHPSLPAPDVQLKVTSAPGTYDWTWGLYIALHYGLGQFEQWRAALGLDPATVEQKQHGMTAWLIATGTHSGVPVELYGFYPHDTDDER
ncbi:hypothetical protein ACIQOW_05340 [Kitasatospora sp. NPDC091335]|uniref:hypothetical protein n=1 Tax=Kitasatospora sp. NPDC091335 TaxID=3364085 RepID=UPI0038107FBA